MRIIHKDYEKISYKNFEELKYKVKFIEFYWMCYKVQHSKKDYSEEIMEKAEMIDDFIYMDRYEELKKVEINFIGTKVKMKKINYIRLKTYATLSKLLLDSIT
ncbi:hypothetical protein CKN99_15745 [Carnobacterium maltaromaticum]|uniref:hypothetical protein n=2 Tax=Carnobacterium maltaromaticum TaxID=2751 RepID=UPI0007053403|nr:hypothetical protein [Carnobacterium maltaromaticum]TFJ24733.1 hypothetical protein CKN90_15705 [Carnobacterium maltaromaticum]TFJ30138.1 hypothetical protein CKN98_15710 [Carnobacterium maltaromaticum]TFJ33276.1 hypothetical protein CKN88_15670 [Carnobacterium maltaromaticum]TFJ35391.1 hypothetical protein CKN99_15745 [Carnobacterium maltaromaticum]TFJ42582.1 hypothetical protein CKN92_15180 [Carnobacterium maltaromaticum]